MQGIQYYDVKFPYVQSSGKHSTYWYVLVHTGMNWCRNTLHLNHNLTLTSLHCMLDLFLVPRVLLKVSLLHLGQ
jgi:hypothetical protein